MIPDKFNRVDLEGIDVLLSQGVELTGLYSKLNQAISSCRYQILYNWKFDGILIPPTYVHMVSVDGTIYINQLISVTSDDVIHIHSIESPAVINPITITENGIYEAGLGVDGYNPVEVNVPTIINIVPLSVVENGTYIPEEADGYSPVVVNVPPKNLFSTNFTTRQEAQNSTSYDGITLVNNGLLVPRSYRGGSVIPVDDIGVYMDFNWSQPFKIHLRFIVVQAITSGQTKAMFGGVNDFYSSPACELSVDGIGFGFTTNGSTWSLWKWLPVVWEVNAIYDADYSHDGENVTLTLFKNGVQLDTYTQQIAPHFHSSSKVFSFAGYGTITSNYPTGTIIDLKNTYIESNGSLVWGTKQN